MSSSSVSSGCSLTRKCHCGDEVVLKPSGTDLNPGRRFLGCPKYPDPNRCSFFEWVDDPICKRGKAVILEQKEMIGKLYDQIKYMREKANFFEDKAKEYEKKAQEYEDKAKEFDNMTQVYEWRIKEMKRIERKKIKEARTMEINIWMKLLVALLVMENAEKKTLTGFCYWSGERKLNANGTFLYNGGTCVAVLLEEGSKINELREKVCGALNMNLEGKLYFYNTKRDKTKYVTLNDDNGVAMLFHLNEDDVDLFVEDIGQNNDNIPTFYDSTRESMVTHNISSPGGTVAVPSPSQVTNSSSQEMGLVPYLPENANEILTWKGQLFDSPDLFKQSVLLFAASNKFSFNYLDNSRTYYRLVCKVVGCPWKLTAKCEGSTDLVRIIMFRNEHLHNVEDASNYKLTFRSKQVGLLFKNRIVDKPGYLPRDICRDFEHTFQCCLNYSQGWRAKEKAKEAITGPPSMTFHLVPWMCRRLVEAIPNTRAIWTSTNEGKFKQLFVSYGCSIAAFRKGYLRPVLKLDAYFLTGYYRGHVISASAHDADDGLYPLAYAIVSSENDEDWLWFLINLKEVIGGRQVVLVTDRNTSLLSSIIKVFGGDCNSWCLRHLKENFSKSASSKGLKAERRNTALKVVNDLAYARTEDSFKSHLGKLYGICPDLSKWVEDNNPKHWSNAFFPYKRWDKMYTNLAECFNSWLLPLRELDIIQFMTGHVSKTTELLLRKHIEVRKWKLPVGKQIKDDIKKSQEYAQKFTHRNSSPTKFIVANDTRRLYAVKLIPRS
ncbi:uncharacterized protein LOC131306780 [Rhododendron vialii]|uniref:uncharacterized protein LOC131306780 n=1 Tax=Rhododendron vialii TaxID=182163 RepID=UPI00265DE39B|nr:uncharacterized protein LOC131306780 [Rhododendron vialii]